MRLADGSFSARAAQIATDPRRAARLAERFADGEPLNASRVPPGTITQDAASLNQLLASGVNFDRAGFAYDTASYLNYTVNGSGAGPPSWTKVGANNNNLRLGLGDIPDPIYVWIWGSFSWANNGTGADGRVVACLYDSFTGFNTPVCRASNIANNRAVSGNTFTQFVYMGFIAIDEAVLSGALGTGVGEQDWNIGLQHQLAGAQQVANQSASRQSLVAFVSSFPPDGSNNYTVDNSLG